MKSRIEVEEGEVVLLLLDRFYLYFCFLWELGEWVPLHVVMTLQVVVGNLKGKLDCRKKEKNKKIAMVLRGVTWKGFQKDRVNWVIYFPTCLSFSLSKVKPILHHHHHYHNSKSLFRGLFQIIKFGTNCYVCYTIVFSLGTLTGVMASQASIFGHKLWDLFGSIWKSYLLYMFVAMLHFPLLLLGNSSEHVISFVEFSVW